jgi:hypothetical protein
MPSVRTSRLFLLVTLLLVVANLGTGCGSPMSKFVGKWVSPSKDVEFFSDGTYTLNHTNGAIPWQGKFAVLDDGRIKLNGAPVLIGTLTGGTLTLVDPNDNQTFVFQRK